MAHVLKEELEDLQIFSDPFEEFRKSSNEDSWTANFVRKGEELSIRREPDGGIRVLAGPDTLEQRRYRSLEALLVSRAFANLERLANAQLYFTRNLADERTGNPRRFLPNDGGIHWNEGSSSENIEKLTFERVHEVLDRPGDRLHVFIVDGAAGVGKSMLIERIVRSRAAPTSYRSGKPLLLHVESRGKVLTSLNDRIAGALSSLRAGFVEEELKPLVRRGVVQLAIDGFDELSDSRGYKRAWGALRDFIRDLRARGVCILAGRDTMLNHAAVREGLGPTVGSDALVFFRVQHPPSDQVRIWLSENEKWQGRDDELDSVKRQIEHNEYLRRPFFLSRIADLGPEIFRDTHGEPIVEIMESIVRREGRRLAGNGSDVSSEDAALLYREILSETARIMVDDETDGIDVDLLGLLVEEVFTGHASQETISALVQRAGALALMEEEPSDSSRRLFPHETVKSYFFAVNIFETLPEHGMTTGLHRVPLSADDFRIFNRVARSKPDEEQKRLRERMFVKLRETSDHDYSRANIGGLLLAFVPLEEHLEDDRFVLSHMQLLDVWMADLLGMQVAEVSNCHIPRLDVRGADLGRVTFSKTEVHELIVDPFVKLGASVPEVHSIVLYERPDTLAPERFYGSEVQTWLAQRAPRVTGDDPVPDEKWPLLVKFARISRRQYWICSIELDVIFRRIGVSPLWPALRALLDEHERLEVKMIPFAFDGRGRKMVKWFHLVAGEEFLYPKPDCLDSTKEILAKLNVPFPY